MTKIKVHAPNEAYKGRIGSVQFDKGVATVDEGAPELAYFRRRGYGLGEPVENPVLPYDKLEPTRDGEIVDARDFGEQRNFGRPLRDAAVDPHPDDFLPPTNAGEANPHGPAVVAPEIHASGPAGIRAGVVHVDDVRRQEREETELAARVLVEGAPATEQAVTFDADTNMGPLGLSDPGSTSGGMTDGGASGPPAKSARVAAWRAYAVSQGMSEDEAGETSKDELVERFGGA